MIITCEICNEYEHNKDDIMCKECWRDSTLFITPYYLKRDYGWSSDEINTAYKLCKKYMGNFKYDDIIRLSDEIFTDITDKRTINWLRVKDKLMNERKCAIKLKLKRDVCREFIYDHLKKLQIDISNHKMKGTIIDEINNNLHLHIDMDSDIVYTAFNIVECLKKFMEKDIYVMMRVNDIADIMDHLPEEHNFEISGQDEYKEYVKGNISLEDIRLFIIQYNEYILIKKRRNSIYVMLQSMLNVNDVDKAKSDAIVLNYIRNGVGNILDIINTLRAKYSIKYKRLNDINVAINDNFKDDQINVAKCHHLKNKYVEHGGSLGEVIKQIKNDIKKNKDNKNGKLVGNHESGFFKLCA